MIPVTNRQRVLAVSVRAVRQVVRAVHAHEGAGEPRVGVAVVDDATIRRLNREHLQHDYETDVLAWAYDDEDPSPEALSGEVVVSAETALREARERGGEPAHELLLYVAHGVLHLLGWEDDTPARRRRMNARARAILSAAGLAR